MLKLPFTPLLAALTLLESTYAWGDVGHRSVAYLAQYYFTPEADSLVKRLLANDNGWDISDAATWPDTLRWRRPWTSTWHYIDAQDEPPNSCNITYKRDCGDACIVSAIKNQTSLILNDTISDVLQKEALMFIIHFIGDIHQPLHTETLERGGNGIHACFDGLCNRENLHGIWDTDIVHKMNGLHHRAKHNEEKTAAKKFAESLHDLQSQDVSAAISLENQCNDISNSTTVEDCAMIWATEANHLVCSYVLEPGVEWIENHDLGGDYYLGAVPLIKVQITKAGVRLAAWINAIAKAKSSDDDAAFEEVWEL